LPYLLNLYGEFHALVIISGSRRLPFMVNSSRRGYQDIVTIVTILIMDTATSFVLDLACPKQPRK
jgi:hypothetical protein